jgi:hypothetical protein
MLLINLLHKVHEVSVIVSNILGDVMKCAGGFTIEHMEPYLSLREGEMETITGIPNALTKKLILEALRVGL